MSIRTAIRMALTSALFVAAAGLPQPRAARAGDVVEEFATGKGNHTLRSTLRLYGSGADLEASQAMGFWSNAEAAQFTAEDLALSRSLSGRWVIGAHGQVDPRYVPGLLNGIPEGSGPIFVASCNVGNGAPTARALSLLGRPTIGIGSRYKDTVMAVIPLNERLTGIRVMSRSEQVLGLQPIFGKKHAANPLSLQTWLEPVRSAPGQLHGLESLSYYQPPCARFPNGREIPLTKIRKVERLLSNQQGRSGILMDRSATPVTNGWRGGAPQVNGPGLGPSAVPGLAGGGFAAVGSVYAALDQIQEEMERKNPGSVPPEERRTIQIMNTVTNPQAVPLKLAQAMVTPIVSAPGNILHDRTQTDFWLVYAMNRRVGEALMQKYPEYAGVRGRISDRYQAWTASAPIPEFGMVAVAEDLHGRNWVKFHPRYQKARELMQWAVKEGIGTSDGE